MEKLNQLSAEEQSTQMNSLDKNHLHEIVKGRSKKQKGISMQYFWAALVLQIIVYALLSNVIIKYWNDSTLRMVSLFCILIYVPFTLVLLRDFKKIAILRTQAYEDIATPLSNYIHEQHRLLLKHYQFKKRYEFLLITCSVAIMTWVILRIYFPGGIMAHPILAASIFIPSLVACLIVSRKDDKKHFQAPLKQLEDIIADLNS